jgi:hypothetical protein
LRFIFPRDGSEKNERSQIDGVGYPCGIDPSGGDVKDLRVVVNDAVENVF